MKSGVRSIPNRAAKRNDQCVDEVLRILAELVPQIARSIMRDCEVTLHDNRTSSPCISAIGNGHVTGREVGDPMTRIAVGDGELKDLKEPLFNYESVAPDGRPLRVSLLPVVISGKTVAYLAINFSTGDLLMAQSAIAQLTRTEPNTSQITETFLANAVTLEKVFQHEIDKFSRPSHMLGREDRIELVRRLHDQGLFNLRGAVHEIAMRLGISRAAVYNYLKLAVEDTPSDR
jgi:predicted transcriptional regulator YheO